MWESIAAWLTAQWDRITPVEIIDVYSGGGVLRWGKYHRTIGPGFHWKWPLAERVVEVLTCQTTQRVPPQSLTTKDGVNVVISCIVRYEITDVEKFVSLIWDQVDVLVDTTMAAVRKATAQMVWKDILDAPPEDAVLELVRKGVNRFGFKIHAVTFADLAKVNSIRLIQPYAKDLAN
jgi:regulator of protease activity HflC (stomatin/prohibitin superfamily)